MLEKREWDPQIHYIWCKLCLRLKNPHHSLNIMLTGYYNSSNDLQICTILPLMRVKRVLSLKLRFLLNLKLINFHEKKSVTAAAYMRGKRFRKLVQINWKSFDNQLFRRDNQLQYSLLLFPHHIPDLISSLYVINSFGKTNAIINPWKKTTVYLLKVNSHTLHYISSFLMINAKKRRTKERLLQIMT